MATPVNILAGVFSIAILVCTCFANKKTLVLVDNWSVRETHSVYFRSLRGDRLNVYIYSPHSFLSIDTATYRQVFATSVSIRQNKVYG